MASGFVEHITSDGDRWDSLAWKYYGDPYAYERIIRANPAVPIIPILPAGIRLLIPVIDPPQPAETGPLPPWM